MDTGNTNVSSQIRQRGKKSKVEKIDQRIDELKRQKRAIQARENEKERKARTRRLIRIGAIAIKYLDCPNDIEPEEFENKIKRLLEGF